MCIEYATKYKDITVKVQKDIQPTIPVIINNLLIKDTLVDSGIRIDRTSTVIVNMIGNPIHQNSSIKVDIMDGCLASHYGVIEDVECFDISFSMDLHVILLRGSSCSLLLVDLRCKNYM